jgi:hypothetical protein
MPGAAVIVCGLERSYLMRHSPNLYLRGASMFHFPAARGIGAAILLVSSAMLGGCFLAEGDDADPIIPTDRLAYPLKMGGGQQCSYDSGEETCERAQFEKLPEGGYRITTWSVDDDGEEAGDGSSQEYKLRLLKGAGVPAATFLVQSVDASESQRFLGLLKRRLQGGWTKISPSCDKLNPAVFVEFMNSGWLRTGEDATLNGVICHIRRGGLDDARLYRILDAAKPDDNPTVLYDEG